MDEIIKPGWYVEIEKKPREIDPGDMRLFNRVSGPHPNYRAAYKASKEWKNIECRIIKDQCGVRHSETTTTKSERLP